MDEIFVPNDNMSDSYTSSNASVDEYLASIRSKNNKEVYTNSNNINLPVSLTKEEDASPISSNNTSISQEFSKNNNFSSKSNNSTDIIEVDINQANEKNEEPNEYYEKENLTSKNDQVLDIDVKIEIDDNQNDHEDKITEKNENINPNKKKKKKKNVEKNPLIPSNQQKKKRKKRKHSLFDPEKYQNKPSRLTEQQEKWMSPPIKKPKKEIDEMVDRLSKPPARFDVKIPENLMQKKPPSDPQIFNRLYEMSTEKEKKNEERRIQQEKEQNEYFLNLSPKSNAKSLLLAEKMLIRFVERCFNIFPKDSTIASIQESSNNTMLDASIPQNEVDADQKESNGQDQKENQNNDNILSDLDENNYYFKSQLSQEELDELLINLGLRSRRENMPKFNKILFEKMNDWVLKEKQDGSRIYDAIKIHQEMIHVIKEGEFSFSSFDRFARQRIIIALANSKQFSSLSKTSIYSSTNESLLKPSNESLNNNDNEESTSFQSQKKCQYKSLIRLSQSKRKNCESPIKDNKKEQSNSLSIRPRPKFVMNPYSEELEPASVSAKTEKIFQKSEVANIPFVERDQFFTQKRRKMIEQMSKESNKSQLMKFEHKPKFSQEVRNELNEYKERKEQIKNRRSDDEPTYHPKIMNYEKYKKTIHREMTEKKVRPEGWDNDIARHRVAYQRYLQEKLAKEKDKEPDFDMMNELDIVSKYKL